MLLERGSLDAADKAFAEAALLAEGVDGRLPRGSTDLAGRRPHRRRSIECRRSLVPSRAHHHRGRRRGTQPRRRDARSRAVMAETHCRGGIGGLGVAPLGLVDTKKEGWATAEPASPLVERDDALPTDYSAPD